MASRGAFSMFSKSTLHAQLTHTVFSTPPAEALWCVHNILGQLLFIYLFSIQHIASSDPLASPAIDPKYLSRDYGKYFGGMEKNTLISS